MNNANQVFTLATVLAACSAAEKRYLAKNPVDDSGNAITASRDIAKGRKYLTEKIVAEVATLIDGSSISPQSILDAISNTMPVKAVMRCCIFFSAVAGKDYNALDAVTTLSILSNAYAGAKTTDALLFASTGKGDDNTSAVVKNTALVRKLQTLLQSVGVNTAPTQLSRSFGKNGFCAALGIGRMTVENGQRELANVDTESPFFKRVSFMIENATPDMLAMMQGAQKKKGKGK